MQFFQGDIGLLKANKEIKKRAAKLIFKPLTENLVVAEGEVTGHKHIIVAEPQTQMEMAQDENGYYIKVNSGKAILTHDKHAPQIMDTGLWFVAKQFEFDEILEHRVQD